VPQSPRDHAVIRRYYELFNARQLEDAAALVSDDCTFEHTPTRNRAVGRRGYLAMATDWLNAFPDASVKVEKIVTLRPTVYQVTLRGRGHRDGEFELSGRVRVPPDGKAFEFVATQEMHIVDGRITASTLSYNRAELIGPIE
jgi:steroid delta-isomerase-like uncharacterized protein